MALMAIDCLSQLYTAGVLVHGLFTRDAHNGLQPERIGFQALLGKEL